MLQNRFMSKRIDNIFNESIATSISEPDVEIRPFDPLIEHQDSPQRHLYQFSVEFFWGMLGMWANPKHLPIIEKKIRQVLMNNPLQCSQLHQLVDTLSMHREFPKLHSYRFGYVIYFNMCQDDFSSFIRFIDSLLHCFPSNQSMTMQITKERECNEPIHHYTRNNISLDRINFSSARIYLSEFSKNPNNPEWLNGDNHITELLKMFLNMFWL